MDIVSSVKEAQDWFLAHSSGEVIARNSLGKEKVCNFYFEAEELLTDHV